MDPGLQKSILLSVGSVVLVLFLLIALYSFPGNNTATTPEASKPIVHVVQKGEFIIKIAQQKNVPWESIVLLNEETLRANVEKRCTNFSTAYTDNARRHGHYCNNRVRDAQGRSLVYANTLQPGDELLIPTKTLIPQIRTAVNHVSGNRIVIVIDDTGSMSNDRLRVTSAYLQAVRDSGKQIARVLVFADHGIRELDLEQPVFQAMGSFENTRAAVERANAFTPDAIVLVTDEPGDDWEDLSDLKSVPVIAHSLDPMADEQMKRVASQTNGQFVESHSGTPNLAVK